MKIELKNVKVCEWKSEETTCFTASVYVDGVRAFQATDEGNGGCIDFEPYNKGGFDLLQKAEEYAKSLSPVPSEFFDDGLPMNLELLVSIKLGEYLEKRDTEKVIKKFTKTGGLVYRLKTDEKNMFRSIGDHRHTREQKIAWLEKNHKDNYILIS